MKKRMYVLGVAALLAALMAMSGVAQSAMWVGAEMGGNFNPNTKMQVGNSSDNFGTNIRASVIGGVTLGYDFVNAGFAAYAWPDWMKYFSFAMDLTYNRLDIHSNNGFGHLLSPSSRFNGYEVAWTFLFMAHYGFLPDSEVPGGRINPYIGVGPAIVWTGAEFSTAVDNTRYTGRYGVDAMNVALVVEPGIRWVCFKNVSVDTAMRYRYSVPSWGIDGSTVKANPLHQIAFLLRANYHF
jgi:opacity protein-like surface antigen